MDRSAGNGCPLEWKFQLNRLAGVAFSPLKRAPVGAPPASTPRYRPAEDVGFPTVVMAELKLCQVERQILLGDVMIGAHHAQLEQCPERINVGGMHFRSNGFRPVGGKRFC